MPLRLHSVGLAFCLLVACACSRVPTAKSVQPGAAKEVAISGLAANSGTQNLTVLFSHIWRLTNAPSRPPAGSIYIFLSNGTLLETSCVETYRIAAWNVDSSAPSELRVTEDHQLAFTANIAELNDRTLRLHQQLIRSKEARDLTFEAVENEFVCPDLPK
jgi:hypothetical protein